LLRKYSHSPPLALTIRYSRIRQFGYCTLVVAVICALVLVVDAGYESLAVGMLLLAALNLWSLRIQPYVGLTFGWREGQWKLFLAGQPVNVELLQGNVHLPWLTSLVLLDPASGHSRHLVLFDDSAHPEALRKLRSRLTLKG
jgi:membrane-bound toxin of toxin-antitoxin system